jgi:signal transduction histidine kinase
MQPAPISSAPDLAAFLMRTCKPLAHAWADSVCGIPSGYYRDLPFPQVYAAMLLRLGALSDALERGSPEPLDTQFVADVLQQLHYGCSLDEALSGVLLAKEALLPTLLREAGHDAALLERRLAALDACLRYVVARVGSAYAAAAAQRLATQEQHTQLMLDAARTASSSLDLDQVLRRIATSIATAVAAPDCGIYLRDQRRDTLILRATTRPVAAAPPAESFTLNTVIDPLLSAVLTSRQPVLFPDPSGRTDVPPFDAVAFEPAPLLALPMIAPGDRLIGVAIVVGRDAEHRFTEAQMALAWGMVQAVALAVDNAQLYTDLRRQLSESEAMEQIVAGLLRELSLADVLQLVCTQLLSLSGAQAGAVLLRHDDNWLHLAAAAGSPPARADRLAIDGSFPGQALTQRRTVFSNAPDAPASWLAPLSLLAAPLVVGDTLLGALTAAAKPGGFTADDERIVARLAGQAAVAIRNAQLHEQHMQRAAEGTRQQLAIDLHDAVSQALYSLTLYSRAAIDALTDGNPSMATRHLHDIELIAREALSEMRLLIYNLRPPDLEQLGLAGALQARLDAVEMRAALQTELCVEGAEQLPHLAQTHLYHIAQEALNNVLKHARARRVAIHLTFSPTTVQLRIRDDGCGFDPHATAQGGGLGLRGIAERVAQLAGNVRIESTPGAGTCITVEVPL